MKLVNSDIKTMMRKITVEQKILLCIGIGQFLTEACECFDEYNFFKHIESVYDNNPREFKWRNHTVMAKPINEIVHSLKDAVIYISTGYYPEIYEQLNAMPETKEIECYIHTYVSYTPLKYVLPIHTQNAIRQIPKRIHYCWFGRKAIPERNQNWMQSWKKYCPDYEIVRWDEDNYDIKANRYMYEAYQEGKYGFVPDYARLDIIYKHGGVYLDTDVELVSSLDKLLYSKAYCGMANSVGGPTLGAGFGAIPGFKLFAEMRDYYNTASFYNKDGTINLSSSGAYRVEILKKYGYKTANALTEVQGLTIYPTDVLSPQDYNGVPISFTTNTISVHHFDASWQDKAILSKRDYLAEKARKFHEEHQNEFSTVDYGN